MTKQLEALEKNPGYRRYITANITNCSTRPALKPKRWAMERS